jgi:hypothetical protein
MSLEVGQLTAATTQAKLCTFDEEEQEIWFRLIKMQLAVAGIKSQKLKYANALANLPKQVLWDILDTVDACNESDQPFDELKTVLLDSLAKASGSLTLSCFTSHLTCKASSLAFSWASSNSLSRIAAAQTMTCSLRYSSFDCCLPCEKW